MHLDRLLQPRSIAILGASERPSIGNGIITTLKRMGFDGAVYPVNRRYETVLGLPCYPSLHSLPEPPDTVAFCIGRERMLEGMEAAAGRGAGAAVIYGGGYAESGDEGRALERRVADVCREAGIALLGPNCMGSVSPWSRSTTYAAAFASVDGLAGNVGIVSQSGSVSIGLLSDLRRFGFSHVVSSGNEAVSTTASFLDYLVDDPHTRVIGLFLETANAPERFVAALDRAADAGKPVVVLKVGRSERARRSIATHTGGLAGRADVFSAMLRAHRAIEVRDVDEMSEVLALCQGEVWPTGQRIAVVTASGGQAELILDIAGDAGIDLPSLPDTARAEIEQVTGPLTGDGNPTDAWGSGDFRPNLDRALAVLRKTGAYDAIGLCMDSAEKEAFEDRIVHAAAQQLADSGRKSGIPHFMLATRSGLMNSEHIGILAAAGQAQLTGLQPGLKAIRHLALWMRGAKRGRKPGPCAVAETHEAWGDVAARPTINERDAKRLLGAAGVRVAREAGASSVEDALAAASKMGYPVVLKAFGDRVPHRTDLGLVRLDIADPRMLCDAWHALERTIRTMSDTERVEGMLVQEMITGGIEVFAGVKRDPQFGLTLAFGLGGIAVELLQDFVLRLLPLAEGDAEAMISEIRGHALLGSVRGRPPADMGALVRSLYALSDFAVAHERLIDEMDLNPIKVMPEGEGCIVIDALIVPCRSVT